jgi:FKBP-type peptidyl-prolyl cis-trans isomerase
MICTKALTPIIKILALIPSLRVLDGERFDPKFLERRQKQKKHLEFISDLKEKKQRVQEYREKRRQKKDEKAEAGETDETKDTDKKSHGKKTTDRTSSFKGKKRGKTSETPNKRPKVKN